MRRLAIVVAIALTGAAQARAQSDLGPKAGTWGGEACLNCGASLLHFRNATSAWLLGLSVFYSQQHSDQSGPTFPSFSDDDKIGGADVRFGMRRYRATEARARPYLGLGAIAGLSGGGSTHGLRYGVTSEMGTAYFFTPHLSVGVAGTLSLIAQNTTDNSGGFTSKRRSLFAGFNGFSVLAAVYF
jgi:hypothetical protein